MPSPWEWRRDTIRNDPYHHEMERLSQEISGKLWFRMNRDVWDEVGVRIGTRTVGSSLTQIWDQSWEELHD